MVKFLDAPLRDEVTRQSFATGEAAVLCQSGG
jgi:hypothetical protein